jgi:transcriptional regulator GlxA family with amidase domain
MREPVIVFPLFPGGLALDFVGPHIVFSRIPGARVILASTTGGEIRAEGGIIVGGLQQPSQMDSCDIICVPGGAGVDDAILDEIFLTELRRLCATARFITSVCTGSLALGAAGLLRGKRAACHWFAREFLMAFGATPDHNRVARDGNVITSGGVTAGIDFALSIAAELVGADIAQEIQLQIEYAPAPPFNAGTPETAPSRILSNVSRRYAGQSERRRAAVDIAAARLTELMPL